jgi:hypothetical protein
VYIQPLSLFCKLLTDLIFPIQSHKTLKYIKKKLQRETDKPRNIEGLMEQIVRRTEVRIGDFNKSLNV